jgi:glucosamine--fructose-6-phosphate aminotransferase (isomerizing)
LAIDAQALPLRGARVAVEAAMSLSGPGGHLDDEEAMLDHLAPVLADVAQPFISGLRDGAYNGHLEAATAVRLVSLLRFATGVLPIEVYELETGKVGAPGVLVADLVDSLSRAIDELTRPVDAIKHQAKTVTVGISRSEDALLALPLVKEALAAGAAPDSLGYRALRTLAGLDPAVEEVLGFTRYRIDWPNAGGIASPGAPATITVVDQGGVARDLPSRTRSDPRLRGTKHRAAEEREVTVARGRMDGRTVVLAPEVKRNQVIGMTLLHVRFHRFLSAPLARQVLSSYRNRYAALSDAVTETEPTFDDRHLESTPIVELLTEPVYVLADRWRRSDS